MKKLISLLLLISTMVVDAQTIDAKRCFPGKNSGTIQQIIKQPTTHSLMKMMMMQTFTPACSGQMVRQRAP
ncbi:MAG: hypothetical protein R2765_06515 [Ferruginibacter sp.]